jgi:CHAT domain-containing protein/Tfp pilus assembly protein PilF
VSAKFAFCVIIALAVSSLTTESLQAAAIIPRQSSGRIEQAAAPDQADPVPIDPAKAIQRELRGGQKSTFRIGLADGQYAKVLIEQQGIDIIARLLSPAGKVIIEVDADPRKVGEEVVEFTTTGCGDCLLTVEPRQKNAAPGRYEVRVAELRPATEKDFVLNEARQLQSGATMLWKQDKYDEALPLAERALSIREKELGPDDPDVATSLFGLANICSDNGESPRVEPLYLRALAIREKHLGPDHIAVSPILNNLGAFYKEQGEYVKAQAVFQRVLDIREKSLEPDHLLIASVLNNLANIARVTGEDSRAEGLYKRVIAIREKALGPEHPDVATALNNLANVYTDPQKSEPLYRRALAIREKALGPDHPDVAQTLYNLALLYSSEDQFPKAEEFCRRAQAIWEKSLGSDHPFISYPLNLLGVIYKATGDYATSESLYLRSIAIKEKTQGNYHPDLAGTLANLANLYAVKGDLEKAISTQARANDIFEYNIRLNLAAGSEEQKLTYLRTLADIEDQTIMLHLQKAANSSAAAELAANTVLQRKGRVLDAMANSFETLRRRSSPQDQRLLDQLNDTTKKLAKLVFEGPQKTSAAEHDQQIRSLEEQRENIEREVSKHSSGVYQQTQPVTVTQIQSALPSDAALLEFAVYRPISPKAYEFVTDRELDPNAVGAPRYVAYVIRAQGEVHGIDVGPTKEIDGHLVAFRQALRNPQRTDVQRLGRVVDQEIMQPVRAIVGDAARLLISPDGDLNLIPFEALRDEQGQYLIEKYSISYLTTGRDVLRLQVARGSRTGPLILADPTYGEPQRIQPNMAAEKTRLQPANLARRGIATADDLSTVYFPPLTGTAQEARSIKSVFPEATVLTGRQATKQALEQADAPRILHIATHGFFLKDGTEETREKALRPGGQATRSIDVNVKIKNPLLRSGLALSGANLSTGQDNGILTALEASNLNLWGTKLVALSACDTGVGAIRNGEGVFGLRRAFFLAGTETLVMSLWPVSDYVTRELMTSYYAGLNHGLGRGEALRQTKLTMLKRNHRRHPFYWASFIQAGDWAALDGERR